MTLRNSFRRMAAALALASAAVILLFAGPAATAQSLAVLPVNILFSPGQKASSLTVTNKGTSETAIQIRAYAWSSDRW
jgi:fimbrial chaperone protein